jgi:hypothetical protein
MIKLFMTKAAARALSLEEMAFMCVSECMAVIDPYCHNTARAVPVAETGEKRAFGR